MTLAKETKAAKRPTSGDLGDEFSAYLAAWVGGHLIKQGIETRQAENSALEMLSEMRLYFGGQNIYFPRGTRSARNERNLEIYNRHLRNEATIPELAQEYGHSIQWIYRILNSVREQKRRDSEAFHEATRAQAHERWKREN